MLKPRTADVIMDIRAQGVMSVHWTEKIDGEFLRNATRVFGINAISAGRRLMAMKRRCPEWEVPLSALHFSKIPKQVDPKDRHVAAAALSLRHNVGEDDAPFDVLLVTDNTKDFASEMMATLGVRVITSGEFLDEAFGAEPDSVERAIDQAVRDLKTPPYTLEELLFALRKQGAHKLANGIARTRGVTPRRKSRPHAEPWDKSLDSDVSVRTDARS